MTIQYTNYKYNHRKRVWIWNFFLSFLFEFRPSVAVVYIFFARSALFVSGCRRRRHRRIRSLPLADRPAVTLSPPVRPSTPPRALTARYTCSPVPVCRDQVSNPNRQSDPAFLVSGE